MSDLHIYAPPSSNVRRICYCRTCQRRRRVVQYLYAWLEPLWHCTGCGEHPGRRGIQFQKITFARRARIAKIKRDYNAATDFETACRMVDERGY